MSRLLLGQAKAVVERIKITMLIFKLKYNLDVPKNITLIKNSTHSPLNSRNDAEISKLGNMHARTHGLLM